MKGDIALAGYVLTAEEWDELDALSRAQLIAAANRRDDAWIISAIGGAISGPIADGSSGGALK